MSFQSPVCLIAQLPDLDFAEGRQKARDLQSGGNEKLLPKTKIRLVLPGHYQKSCCDFEHPGA